VQGKVGVRAKERGEKKRESVCVRESELILLIGNSSKKATALSLLEFKSHSEFQILAPF
jgi:uncharacterized ferredoxin-like protein